MGDVSAIVLSNGEPCTARALACLDRQTLCPEEVLLVGPEVSPFYRAFNAGAEQVKTEFFVQVDSDMVLDEDCVEGLRSRMSEGVGMVSGLLRDPLLLRIMGVHLFRTECVRATAYSDSVVPESDFSTAMQDAGWILICALAPDKPGLLRNTFGLHDPGYTLASTYSKFLVTGSQIRHRGVGVRARSLLDQLLNSRHEHAIIACLAAARGYTLALHEDFQRPFSAVSECAFLERFFGSEDQEPLGDGVHLDLGTTDWRGLFDAAARVGQELSRRRSPRKFVQTMRTVYRTPDLPSFVALTGLCDGVFRDLGSSDSRYHYEHLVGLFN